MTDGIGFRLDASGMGVFSFRGVTVANGATVKLVGSSAVALVSAGNFFVYGVIDARPMSGTGLLCPTTLSAGPAGGIGGASGVPGPSAAPGSSGAGPGLGGGGGPHYQSYPGGGGGAGHFASGSAGQSGCYMGNNSNNGGAGGVAYGSGLGAGSGGGGGGDANGGGGAVRSG